MSSTPWLNRAPNPLSPLHVLCFGYSAAPPGLFDAFRIPGVDLLPVQLPGRGPRADEPLATSMGELAERISTEVLPHVPGRFALLGHSMGAWVAHAVASQLVETAGRGPERLVLLSAPPQHLPGRRIASFHAVSDAELVDWVIEFGGAPASARPSIEANIEALRADLTVVGTYQPWQETRIRCPVTVMAADDDPLAEIGDLPLWKHETSGEVSVRLLQGGGHFLLHQPERISRLVGAELRAVTTGGSLPEPVALIGMSCRFPGTETRDEFWELLTQGRDSVRTVPADRPRRSTPVMDRGGFLSGVELFDPGFFGMAEYEAQRADPRLRLLLMVTQEALDDAALTSEDVAGPRSGAWVAESHQDYWDLSQQGMGATMRALSGGGLKSFLSGRIAYQWGLRGPNVTLDTACSSSLVALHNAAHALRAGEVDTALVGTTHLLLNPDGSPSPGLARAFSPNGRCAFADAGGDGYIRSEGIAAFVLRRLSDATANGDPVHAVLDGTAVTANGHTGTSIVTTSATAQQEMMQRALDDAGCQPREVEYIEAHGPGTPAGDAIELQALHEVYGKQDRRCYLGSVKSNIGHAEPSAGAAGLVKTVLAVQNGEIPASLHVNTLNEAIDWNTSDLAVATELVEWPSADHARAAVSSFGLSGVNAHAIVSPPPQQPQARARLPFRQWELAAYWLPEGGV